ncbi:MAG: ATP-binding protein [Kiritimatiellae bacterium]|nr:ATP-binding protein [Kiritimatiellia bacterium]MBQ6328435.1 ATP-binding protein [Kiritimatiellia bacterium]
MVGRKKEIDELRRCYESSESEFVAVYGRRRVGKTYLIRSVFSDKFVFQHSGQFRRRKRRYT